MLEIQAKQLDVGRYCIPCLISAISMHSAISNTLAHWVLSIVITLIMICHTSFNHAWNLSNQVKVVSYVVATCSMCNNNMRKMCIDSF